MIKEVVIALTFSAICNTFSPEEEVARGVTYSVEHTVKKNGVTDWISSRATSVDSDGRWHSVFVDHDGYTECWVTEEGNAITTESTDWEVVAEVSSDFNISEEAEHVYKYGVDTLPDLDYVLIPETYTVSRYTYKRYTYTILRVYDKDGNQETYTYKRDVRPRSEKCIVVPKFIFEQEG